MQSAAEPAPATRSLLRFKALTAKKAESRSAEFARQCRGQVSFPRPAARTGKVFRERAARQLAAPVGEVLACCSQPLTGAPFVRISQLPSAGRARRETWLISGALGDVVGGLL